MIQRAESITKQYIARTQIQREKVRTNNLLRLDNLPMSSVQKKEDLIQLIELQEFQIDLKIQIREIMHSAI